MARRPRLNAPATCARVSFAARVRRLAQQLQSVRRGQVLKRLQRSREVLPQLVAQPLHVQCRSYVSVFSLEVGKSYSSLTAMGGKYATPST